MSLTMISAWNYSCSVWIAGRRVSGPFRLLSLFNVRLYPFLLLCNINIDQEIKTWTFLYVHTPCLTWWVTHGPRRSAQMIARLKSCCLGHLSNMKEVKEITSGSLWENSPDGDETWEAVTERTNTFFFNFPSFVLQRCEYPSWKYGMLYINYAASGLKNIKASNFLSDLKFCKRLIRHLQSTPYTAHCTWREVGRQQCSTKILPNCKHISAKVQYTSLCAHRSRWMVIAFFLLWITVITLDNNPVTLVIHRRAPLAIGLEPFSSGTQKKCNFAAWILYLRSEMKSSSWMKVIFCDCEHYLSCPTCAATAHTHTYAHNQRARAGFYE